MTAPVVSVITPAYNAQNFIAATIQSVINQTYSNWEMVIIDDGSTDNTYQVIELYLSDSRIKYVYQKNQERAVARNQGLHQAKGKYIAFLDADDVWMPDKLQTQVAYLEAHPEVGLCFTRCWLIDGQTVYHGMPVIDFTPGPGQFEQLLLGNFITNSSVMMPQSMFDQVGFFDETLPAFGSEDWDMWLRVSRIYRIHLVDQPLTLYRVHFNNTSLEYMAKSAETVLQKVFADPTLPSHLVIKRSQIYSRIYTIISETFLRLNQRKKALEFWKHAVKVYPGLLLTPRGLWATLKLLLPYSFIAVIPRFSEWLEHRRYVC